MTPRDLMCLAIGSIIGWVCLALARRINRGGRS